MGRIYYVNGQGQEVNPAKLQPLDECYTINEDDKNHEMLLKQLRGELHGDGVIRLTPPKEEGTPKSPEPAPDAAATPSTMPPVVSPEGSTQRRPTR